VWAPTARRQRLLDTFAGYNGSNAFTGGYLHFQASGANTIVQVDSDGGGNSYVTSPPSAT